MSYPDPDRTREEQPRFVGEGFRVEPEFRVGSGAPEYAGPTVPIAGGGFPTQPPEPGVFVPERGSSTLALPHADYQPPQPPQPALTAAELSEVFDNPQHGEPGRDRFGVHATWEAVLLVAAIGVTFALSQRHGVDLGAATIRGLMTLATVVGVFAVGAGLSLRAGAANLAMGPIAVGCSLYFGQHRGDGLYVAGGVALAIAAGIGVVIALLVVALHVPGWAVTLAAAFGLQGWLNYLPSSVHVGAPNPTNQAYYWFAGFAVVAICGAIIGSLHPVRRAIGRTRPVSDPADLRGLPAALATGLALVVSCVLAGFAGILAVQANGAATNDSGLSWSALAIAVALLGGTSVYGRRGGVTGTVLAACLYVLVSSYVAAANWRVDDSVLIGGTMLVGLGVSRLVESFGRPRHADEPADDSAAGWLAQRSSSWSEHRNLELTRGEELARGGAGYQENSDDPWGSR
ncbi:MAG TPA: ABC transporter permease [Micromonosporaceae bacterium]|nr:ABC transporter permease [Micromonosporaceae bacterium]